MLKDNSTSSKNITVLQWGCLVFLLGSITLLILGSLWVLNQPSTPPTGPRPPAIVWTATPTPTATPTLIPTATPLPSPPPAAGVISTGLRVRISGTEGIGLSIRASASTTAERIEIAQEGEIFIVAGGPVVAEEITWWFLRNETDPQSEGWAAANYLAPEP